MSNHLNIDWLKNNYLMIHYFGLGFIQLKLNHSERMHFYTPELPSIISEEDVHNHRYDFVSEILKGELSQEIFEVVEGIDYVKEQESCQSGVVLEGEKQLCDIKLLSQHTYNSGSRYFISHGTFHRVKSNYAVTFLTRGKYLKPYAEVIRKINAPKICPFSKSVQESKLWEIIESMIKSY